MLFASYQTTLIPIIIIIYFLSAKFSKYRPINQIVLAALILILVYISFAYLANIPIENNPMIISPLHRIIGALIFLGITTLYLKKSQENSLYFKLGALLYFVTTGFLFGTIDSICILIFIAFLLFITRKRQRKIRFEWLFLFAITIDYLIFIYFFYHVS